MVPIYPPLPGLVNVFHCANPEHSLAYCEMRLILCKLLFNFDLTLEAESVNWLDQKVYYLWNKPPLMVSLRDRFSSAESPGPRESLAESSG